MVKNNKLEAYIRQFEIMTDDEAARLSNCFKETQIKKTIYCSAKFYSKIQKLHFKRSNEGVCNREKRRRATGKTLERKIKNEIWTAINMTIDKLTYESSKMDKIVTTKNK